MTVKSAKQFMTPQWRFRLIMVLLIGLYAVFAFYYIQNQNQTKVVLDTPALQEEVPLTAPEFTAEKIIDGYSNVWDMVFIDKETILFNERSGLLHVLDLRTGEAKSIGTVPNVRAESEGGLLGMALDYEFESNGYVYACYNHNGAPPTVRVTRFKLTEKNEPFDYTDIVSDIESKAGRHSGCRIHMDTNNHLWIGTGDSAIGTAPQNPTSLAGKVLRVNRDGGSVEGNEDAPFDNRIYSYGHRNIQGITLFNEPLPNGALGLTSEHGTNLEDEINWIVPGNFGWNPEGNGGIYVETAPMTDTSRYADAVLPIWDSGDDTIAVAGVTMLTNQRWQAWKGWVAMAVLKGKHLRLLQIADDGTIQTELEILKEFGRLRAVREAPNGDLYISTDNAGGKDGLIRVSPK